MIHGTVSLPHGTGKNVRVAAFAEGDAAREAGGRRRLRWGRRPRQEGGGRLPRLRCRHRDAGDDGPGRQARSDARPARPDAEPEDGHGHDRRRQGRRRVQGTARSSTAPTATATCTCRSARRASSRRRYVENYQSVLDEILRAKPAVDEGQVHQVGRPASSTMGPGVKIDPAATSADDSQSCGGVLYARLFTTSRPRPSVSLIFGSPR